MVIGLVVGIVLLLAGIPVALTTNFLQSGIDEQAPTFTARYALDSEDVTDVMVVPRKVRPQNLPKDVGSCRGSRNWAHRQGGLDAVSSRVEIEAVGAKDRTVVIRNVRAEKVGPPKPPVEGTVIRCTGQGVGEKTPMALDLDTTAPTALAGADLGYVSRTPYFTNKYIYLENQKPEVLSVAAMATDRSYDYVIKIDGSVDGKQKTWTLKDGDQPFRIAGLARTHRAVHYYTLEGWFTDYTAESLGRERCNTDCPHEAADDRQNTPPAPATSGPAPGPTSEQEPAPDPSESANPPRPRQLAFTGDVDDGDPVSVAIAWAVTTNTHDTTRDTRAHDASVRASVYMTKELAKLNTSGPPPKNGFNALWLHWADHQAWTDVSALVSGLTMTDHGSATVDIYVVGSAYGVDNWRQTDAFADFWKVTLERQSDGAFRVAGFALESSEDTEW
ncbi:hypothetical protein [Streptomyces cucumeris]|uniref:hypothetical protein n=1 Tax=Streptomyces cucumeris TaxID=2962890 RepID=UPI003D737077